MEQTDRRIGAYRDTVNSSEKCAMEEVRRKLRFWADDKSLESLDTELPPHLLEAVVYILHFLVWNLRIGKS